MAADIKKFSKAEALLGSARDLYIFLHVHVSLHSPGHLLSPFHNLSKLPPLHNKLICFDFFVISICVSALCLIKAEHMGARATVL
jgi:hypothetical protein